MHDNTCTKYNRSRMTDNVNNVLLTDKAVQCHQILFIYIILLSYFIKNKSVSLISGKNCDSCCGRCKTHHQRQGLWYSHVHGPAKEYEGPWLSTR